jgi:predicted XRE-type DNA-binding protein
MSKLKTYASVWDAIADTPEQAARVNRFETLPDGIY